ncbi:hypothetical protein [Streptomyces sp. NPDC001851]
MPDHRQTVGRGAAIRHGLRQLQYRQDVLDGFLTGTRLLDSP